MSRCIPTGAATITLGVDTHKDNYKVTHVGVALEGLGRFQGTLKRSSELDRLQKGRRVGE
jgi:hypothetical protein